MNLIEYVDRDMLFLDLANKLAGELETALLHSDRVSLAVPGGTTPGPMFDELCAADIDWSRVDVLLTRNGGEFPPEGPHRHADGVGERIHGLVPHVFQQPLLTEHVTRVLHEVAQEGEFLGGQRDLGFLPGHHVSGGVETKVAEGEHSVGSGCVPPQQRTDTSGKLR